MTAVELRHVFKSFGQFEAVKGVDLTIADGAFVSLLGPSGCGKTTILRMIAGLEEPSSGDIFIKGRRVTDVAVHKRNIGFVFQNYALFPHKTIFDNVAFGLRYRNVSREVVREKVRKACEMVKLPNVGERLPSQLSGGQQQRIALARAIVIEPDVLLLDEPLSALDASLRAQMRIEIRRLQRELGITAIFVTHDQEEALSMSDDIVILDQGLVQQVGTPKEVYRVPETRFVAEFLGQSNIFPASYTAAGEGYGGARLEDGTTLDVSAAEDRSFAGPASVVIRSQRIGIHAAAPQAVQGVNVRRGVVRELSFLGNDASYLVEVGALLFHVVHAVDEDPIEEGSEVWLTIRQSECMLLDAQGKRVPQLS